MGLCVNISHVAVGGVWGLLSHRLEVSGLSAINVRKQMRNVPNIVHVELLNPRKHLSKCPSRSLLAAPAIRLHEAIHIENFTVCGKSQLLHAPAPATSLPKAREALPLLPRHCPALLFDCTHAAWLHVCGDRLKGFGICKESLGNVKKRSLRVLRAELPAFQGQSNAGTEAASKAQAT